MENIKIKSERNYGIDLLRSIAMFMVVTLHTLSFSGLLTKTESLSAKYEVSWLLEIASYCAVNCFVIISGYVGLNSKFRISRVIGLWLQVVFYLVLADLVVQFYNMSAGAEFDMDLFISQFLPVSNKKYWFFTQYFALSFLMPFINKAVKNQSFKSCLTLSLSLFAIFSLLPTIVASPLPYIGTKPAMDLFFLGKGYSVIWLAVLYVSGCTVKKLKEEGKIKIKGYVSLLIYAACVLAVWGIKWLCESAEPKLPSNFVVSYTSVFVTACAVSLLLFFDSIHLGKTASSIIKFVTPNVFAVYLVNSNQRVRKYYIEGIAPILKMPILKMLAFLFLIVIGFFVVAIILDKLRVLLFDVTGINKLIRRLDNTKFNGYFN